MTSEQIDIIAQQIIALDNGRGASFRVICGHLGPDDIRAVKNRWQRASGQ